MGDTKKKPWPGTRTARKKRPELIGDSYQADKEDLKTIRRIARKLSEKSGRKISKAEIIRYGIKLAIMAYAAREKGESVTLTFEVVAQ